MSSLLIKQQRTVVLRIVDNLACRRYHTINPKYKKKTNIDRALEYFDAAYAPIYGERWSSIRLALLSKPKYMAIVNKFGRYDELCEKYEELGAFDVGKAYNEKLSVFEKRHPDLFEDKSQFHTTTTQEAQQMQQKLLKEYTSTLPDDYIQRHSSPTSHPIDPSEDPNRFIAPIKDEVKLSILGDFVPATKLKGLEDWKEETDVFFDRSQELTVKGFDIIKETRPIAWPENLTVYVFPKEDITSFPEPQYCRQLQVHDYMAVGGASLLPVLVLGLKAGDNLLDLCAAPGGKAMAALQTLLPKSVTLNDKSLSRVKRIRNTIQQFIPPKLNITNINFTQHNGCEWEEKGHHDKVLVDVPCLHDRHSLLQSDNSIFKPTRASERLSLPELQCQLLVKGLESVKIGGSVVYSTCTLSPLQNDGVVHMALTHIWQHTHIKCSVVDLTLPMYHFQFAYKFAKNIGLRYGQLVLPNVTCNFGPMYFAKIVKHQ